jgi:hypothetical protein
VPPCGLWLDEYCRARVQVSDVLGPSASSIVAATGLPEMIALGLLRRAIKDTGGTEPPSKDDWRRALPRIEARLRAYLDEETAKHRMTLVVAVIEAIP